MSRAGRLQKHLSKQDLVGLLDTIDSALKVGTEDQFRKLIHRTSELVPIEKAHVSVAELDERAAVVRSSRHINVDFAQKRQHALQLLRA